MKHFFGLNIVDKIIELTLKIIIMERLIEKESR
jgi:hypothetical protein